MLLSEYFFTVGPLKYLARLASIDWINIQMIMKYFQLPLFTTLVLAVDEPLTICLYDSYLQTQRKTTTTENVIIELLSFLDFPSINITIDFHQMRISAASN